MKEIIDKEFLRVFKDLHYKLNMRGLKPDYKRLDNEGSPAFQRELQSKDIDNQPDPPGMNFRNADERATSTFKNKLIGCCSV